MIEDDKAVDNIVAGDVWEYAGVPELVILTVDKGTLEYCDKKIHYGAGSWQWDLEKYMTIPLGLLRNLVCESVPLGEEPDAFRMHVSSIRRTDLVRQQHMRMNRHLHEKVEPLVIEEDGIALTFERAGNGDAILSDGDSSIELNLFTLWRLGDSAYEEGDI
jgi:hypothetical protein